MKEKPVYTCKIIPRIRIILFLLLFLCPLILSTQEQEQFQLQITSNIKGAKVYLDGDLMGTTDVTLTVPAGRTVLTIAYPGYTSVSQVLTISEDATFNGNLNPLIHRLLIQEDGYGGTVYVDDALAGTVPLELRLPTGDYKITIELDGYDTFEEMVSLFSDYLLIPEMVPQFAFINLTLPGDQMIQKLPPYSGKEIRFYLNGEPAEAGKHQIAPGFYHLRIEAEQLFIEYVLLCEPGKTYTVLPYLAFTITSD